MAIIKGQSSTRKPKTVAPTGGPADQATATKNVGGNAYSYNPKAHGTPTAPTEGGVASQTIPGTEGSSTGNAVGGVTHKQLKQTSGGGGGGGGGSAPGPWESGTKAGKWAQGATGKWKSSGGMASGGGGGGGIGKTGAAAAKNDMTQVDRVRSESGFSGMHAGYATGEGGGAGGGGGGTGSPYAPGLSEAVKATGVKSTEQLKGISVEETVKGARRTKKTGQKRSL